MHKLQDLIYKDSSERLDLGGLVCHPLFLQQRAPMAIDIRNSHDQENGSIKQYMS